ncbi:glycosyltransferase family 39 protein [Bradyrhizobium sp. LHD-71]|uniref:glycosyltransferase family 39 protein n=1 Tax=Bradyrhizobium sp. LHD-71 TaxID=3072141 RepID=UPI00280E0019|nr:glycosyltransferase family 39 protein [Bradyrhizobium sp. LHD-71]MDQ8730775.1 glycosyltransferase family 39 protein [Bradyrhizobium sp. LHD-71]
MLYERQIDSTSVAGGEPSPYRQGAVSSAARSRMRFTSLIVELIRARPVLVFWLVVLAQAALWFVLPTLLYASPPGDVALNLAYGREYLLGSVRGPPLAFWLGDLAFRIAGNHMFGVYLLSQICAVVSFWAVFRLGRAIVGEPHAVLAVLLTITITAFAFPGVAFGPHTVAQPLWALTLLNGWRIFGERRREAWFALSIYASLLLLTTYAAPLMLTMLALFALATARGRRALASFDPLFALIVVIALVAPYVMFVIRSGVGHDVILKGLVLQDGLSRWLDIIGGLAFALAGVALVVIFNLRRLTGGVEWAPVIYRPAVDPLGRNFVYCFAILPPALFSILAALFNTPSLMPGNGTMLLLSGLAVVVAAGDIIYLRRQRLLRLVWAWIVAAPALFMIAITLTQPWILGTEVRTMLPAREIGAFFADSFQRRTGRPLTAIAGDPQLAALISYAAPHRPHLLLDASPEKTPWLTYQAFNQAGGVVVWRAADTAGTPPEDIARRFPGLVPEVPRTFERYLNGRQPLLRIGWAIVRPSQAAAAQ